MSENSDTLLLAIGEKPVNFSRNLTIKMLADALLSIESNESMGYEIALLGVESLDYKKICELCKVGSAKNDPNLMPSRFMILLGATDKGLSDKKKLDKFPYDLHTDAPETMSVRSLRRHLILAGFLEAELDDPADTKTDYELDTVLFDAVCAHLGWAALAVEGPLKGGTHLVKKGEGLSDIAEQHGIREWRLLYALNKDILGKEVCDVVPVDKLLKLPDAKDNPLAKAFVDNDWEEFLNPDLGYEYPGKYLSLTFVDENDEPLVFKEDKDGKTTRKCEIYVTDPVPCLLHSIVLKGGDDLDVIIPDTDRIGLWVENEGISFGGTQWPSFEEFQLKGIPVGAAGAPVPESIPLPWDVVDLSENNASLLNGISDIADKGREMGREGEKALEKAQAGAHDVLQSGREAQAGADAALQSGREAEASVHGAQDTARGFSPPSAPAHPNLPRF